MRWSCWVFLRDADATVDLDREKRQILIAPAQDPLALAGVDEAFAKQVSEFIDEYRPALEALAKA